MELTSQKGLTFDQLQEKCRENDLSYPLDFQFAGFDFVCLDKSIYQGGSSPGWDDIIDHLTLPQCNNNAVLEVGSGTGCLVATLYLKKTAMISSILGLDIAPGAVENTMRNFATHGVPGEARLSDVYSSLQPGEKFDLIFWNIPFKAAPVESSSPLPVSELSIVDVGHEAFGRFIKEAPQHLNSGGKLMLIFSPDIGNIEQLRRVAAAEGNQKLEVVCERSLTTVWGSRVLIQLLEAVDMQ